jgi:2',3'-cyclic-nucleotide 2'-phosphodiesterase (5'-nucleotidase family)
MVNLKNYSIVLKHFVLLLTFLLLTSCGNNKYSVSKIEGKKIGITNNQSEVTEIENYIKPYREYIDKDLSTTLAYSPETLDKSKGEWQTNIGNFLADVTFEKCNIVFQSREKKSLDMCILNHGGIRSIIPKGNVTARNAYEVMPFENSATVIALKGEQILEMVNYLISEKKPHPLSGIQFTIASNGVAKDILIQGKPLENNTIYQVVTNDYLANGGDNMTFFKKEIKRTDLDYKLRNILIDYFKDVDTLQINTNKRIIKE